MTDPSYVQASKRMILDTLGLLCCECGERTRGSRIMGICRAAGHPANVSPILSLAQAGHRQDDGREH